jgi:hypothetical protein
MKHIRLHWIVLIIYFIVASAFLLFAGTSHHSGAALPYFLVLLPLLLLFWNPSYRVSSLSIVSFIVVLLFVVLHIAPFVPLAQAHHQASDKDSHSCCMPQIGTTVSSFDLEPIGEIVTEQSKEINLPDVIRALILLNSRAPPETS